MDTADGQVVLVPFDAPIRYEYATLTPLRRPLSKLAKRVKESWIETPFAMIEEDSAKAALGKTSTDF